MFTTTYTTDTIYALTEKDGKRFTIKLSSILHLIEVDANSTLICTIDREFEVETPFNELWNTFYKEKK